VVVGLAAIAMIQALRSVRIWAAIGPMAFGAAAVVGWLAINQPYPPAVRALASAALAVLGLGAVLRATGSTPSMGYARCAAVLRANRKRVSHPLPPELRAVAVAGLLDWDLSTAGLGTKVDINVTAIGGHVALRLPTGCSWSVALPTAGFWKQLHIFAPAEPSTTKARRGRPIEVHVLAIAATVEIIASCGPTPAPSPPAQRSPAEPQPVAGPLSVAASSGEEPVIAAGDAATPA
jgi:hypothetical protein